MRIWRQKPENGPVGLLAGQGEYPLLLAQAAHALGRPFVVIGVEGYADPRLKSYAKAIHGVPIGGVERLIELLRKERIKKVILAGGLPKREIYNPGLAMDETTRRFIGGQTLKGDDRLLKAFQVFLKIRAGVSVEGAGVFLKEILAPRGVLTKRVPTDSEQRDLVLGYRVAKGIGRLDIGQTVVVKDGVVLSVEALEGTDAAISRGAELAGGGAVVVKVSKPSQSLKFDMPCIGHRTLDVMSAAGSEVLGVEAGKTLLLRKEDLIHEADRRNIAMIGL